MRSKRRIIALICTGLLAILCARFFPNVRILSEQARTARDLPVYNGEVTDVRITWIPRTQRALDTDINFIQILYGYEIEGKWTDIPMENYPFYCLCKDGGVQCPYTHASNSHIVQIGNYTLICIEVSDEASVPYDTIGTIPLEPFREFSLKNTETNGKSYGILMEDRTHMTVWYMEECVCSGLSARFYFILDPETLPDNYELHYTKRVFKYFDSDSSYDQEYILTKADILQYISQLDEYAS